MRLYELAGPAPILVERFINAVGNAPQALQTKDKYKQQVWDVLQKSYARIGGLKGSGFGSVDDMVASIPFWKIAIRDGAVRAVVMYKDKNGRKAVAAGTDGSADGISLYKEMSKADIDRAYGEKSKAALGMLMNTIPWEVLQSYTLTPSQAQKNTRFDIAPIVDVPENEWPMDAATTLAKFPQLIDYGYITTIGGNPVFKVMFGTPNKIIR